MWYSVFRIGCVIVLKLFFRLKIEGTANIPKKSNFIVVANHASFLDPLVIAAAFPYKIYCVADRTLYKSAFLRWALKRLDALPTGKTAERAIEHLTKNDIVGLFPEACCSRDGKLKEFRRGVALLSIKTGRPILPCAIIGTFESLPYLAKFPKLLPIKVKIGKPVYLLKEFEDVIDDIYLQEGVHKIKTKIQEMINAG
ncbi:MAG: lysophospholipid acyltransferase family protein [Candidatus Omnitrophica bacterium]|nr:lysophospholipid acyltransferase family protein [Candidatus Omnitrophota bacterium]